MSFGGAIVGAFFGLILGLMYSAIALAIYLNRGSRPFEANEVTLFSTVVIYLLGGLLGGSFTGLLSPLTRTRTGSIGVGMLAFLPVIFGFSFIVEGAPSGWDNATVIVIVLTAVLLGGWAGYLFWWFFRRDGAIPGPHNHSTA